MTTPTPTLTLTPTFEATPPPAYELLTAERALTLLRAAAADRGPDSVYVNQHGERAGRATPDAAVTTYVDCTYVHGTGPTARPGCIVGEVLHRAGVPLDVLRTYEGSSIGTFGQDARLTDEDAQEILQAAQREQDLGRTYGQALTAAEGRMSDIVEIRAARQHQ